MDRFSCRHSSGDRPHITDIAKTLFKLTKLRTSLIAQITIYPLSPLPTVSKLSTNHSSKCIAPCLPLPQYFLPFGCLSCVKTKLISPLGQEDSSLWSCHSAESIVHSDGITICFLSGAWKRLLSGQATCTHYEGRLDAKRATPLPAMACGSAEYSWTSTTQQSRAALSFFSLEAEGATRNRPCKEGWAYKSHETQIGQSTKAASPPPPKNLLGSSIPWRGGWDAEFCKVPYLAMSFAPLPCSQSSWWKQCLPCCWWQWGRGTIFMAR